MKDSLKNSIITCTLENIMFSGSIGTSYSIQELIHAANLPTIDSLHSNLKQQLSKINSDSLFETSGSAKSKRLEIQIEALKEVFEYKQDLAKAQALAAREKQKQKEKLAALKNLKGAKELEELGKKSLAEINAEIELLEG